MAYINYKKMTVKPTFADVELDMNQMKEISNIYKILSNAEEVMKKGCTNDIKEAIEIANKYLC